MPSWRMRKEELMEGTLLKMASGSRNFFGKRNL